MSANRLVIMRAARRVIENSAALRAAPLLMELPYYDRSGRVWTSVVVPGPGPWVHITGELGETLTYYQEQRIVE